MLSFKKTLLNLTIAPSKIESAPSLSITEALWQAIRAKSVKRFDHAKAYSDFVVFCCDVGRLDVVFYFMRYVDAANPLLGQFVTELPNIKRIYDFTNDRRLQIWQPLSMYELSEEKLLSLKQLLLTMVSDEKREDTFFANMVISFYLMLLLESSTIVFDRNQVIDLIVFFKNAQKTEQLRRNTCYLQLFDYVLAHDIQGFFRLPKQNFNHLTYLQHAIVDTPYLELSLRDTLFEIFKNNIKKNNDLSRYPKKLKFAVCISGSYRNHQHCLESVKENLIDPLAADVYIHTWDQMSYWTGYGGAPSVWRTFGSDAQKVLPEKYHRDLERLTPLIPKANKILRTPLTRPINAELFERIFKPQKMIVESEKRFTDSLIHPEGFSRHRGTLNQIKMFWGIKQAFDLALANGKYDIIIRVRPDVKVTEKITPEFFKGVENNVFYSRIWPTTGIADIMFYGTDSVIYAFTRLVDQMIELQELSPYQEYPNYDCHALLAAWVYESNFQLNNKYIPGFIDVNPKIPLAGLREAIAADIQNLTDEQRTELMPILDYIQKNYGEPV
ncbi:hypothetical protein DC083_01165 [Ignatzschineria ureiclastica]|uniref:Capsular biosynthesis protein n=1 Tax=Ignatzschineria ureiclastica TaxID=472582 RepID=A0A2U2AGQ3_9GAMM|nr:hypothetical protein [Ignatzschineria ureiclastica]PWD81833.1 hypothetical protein DC083_01165 [Ignatzschineria ureiclastica]GGZ90802.1 hypothetical protein GCM10007162_02240 [Ignatzschineria ureiclastica]